jgi:hypothetical protein
MPLHGSPGGLSLNGGTRARSAKDQRLHPQPKRQLPKPSYLHRRNRTSLFSRPLPRLQNPSMTDYLTFLTSIDQQRKTSLPRQPGSGRGSGFASNGFPSEVLAHLIWMRLLDFSLGSSLATSSGSWLEQQHSSHWQFSH